MKDNPRCFGCKHFLYIPRNPDKDVWYNHFCKVNKLSTPIDVFDGTGKIFEKITGSACFLPLEYKFCRECDDDNCKYFRPKSSSEKENMLKSLDCLDNLLSGYMVRSTIKDKNGRIVCEGDSVKYHVDNKIYKKRWGYQVWETNNQWPKSV